MARAKKVTGHVKLRKGKRGATWYVRFRLADGSERQKVLGPAWQERGRPPEGYFTRRLAEEALDEIKVQARAGELEGQRPTSGATFRDAAAEFLRWAEVRGIDEKTVRDYRGVLGGYLEPEFGARALEAITADEIEAYAERLLAEGRLTNRTIVRHLTVAHGVFKRAARVWGLESNPASAELVARPKVTYTDEFECFTGDEVRLLAAHADSSQDAAIYIVAAFTGLRQGECLALRWGDVDLVDGLVHVNRNYTDRRERPHPKGKRTRSVPMARELVDRLARLKDREHFTGDGDLVFCTTLGDHCDAWALRRRFYRALKRAGLRRLRFHDLRHTFGSRVIRQLDAHTLQSYMGHQHFGTTARYLHHQPRPEDAAAIERAFGGEARGEVPVSSEEERDLHGLQGR